MSQLDVVLSRLDLQEYCEPLISYGFETWEHLVDITEDDMAELGFKLGHRRKLQRAIADHRGQPNHQPLIGSGNGFFSQSTSPVSYQVILDGHDHQDDKEPTRTKRRYRRHPPKDPHAPQQPKSGYVIFADFIRQNPEISRLPFVDISKHVGEQWQCLLPEEKAIWTSQAIEQKTTYNSELAKYKKTSHYQSFQYHLRMNELTRVARDNKGEYEGIPRIDRCFPSEHPYRKVRHASPTATEEPLRQFEMKEDKMQYEESSMPRGCSGSSSNLSSSSSPLQVFDKTQVLYQQNNKNNLILTTRSLCEASLENMTIGSTHPTLSAQHQSPFAPHLPGGSPVLNAGSSAKNSNSFHIRDLNPFRMVSITTIQPFLDSFLRNFGLAVDLTVSLPNHVMYTLCLCIGIGCQIHNGGTNEMAIMWYENGRRYLDSDDWGWSLNVMRALVLISIYHSNERPTTARHYLDTALRIGEANNLPITYEGVSVIDGTPVTEWILVWETMQAMDSIGHDYRTMS